MCVAEEQGLYWCFFCWTVSNLHDKFKFIQFIYTNVQTSFVEIYISCTNDMKCYGSGILYDMKYKQLMKLSKNKCQNV